MSDRNELERYFNWQELQQSLWESMCGRCGACCGIIEGDPCEHLKKQSEGRYFCEIYENRFGMHKTITGRSINCVPLRDILHQSWPGDQCCGYKKKTKLIN